MDKRDCFCLHSWFHFSWLYLRKNWFKQQWFKFVWGSFFEQNYFSSLDEKWPKCVHISKLQNRNWLTIFFLTLTVRRTFHSKDFSWKRGYGVNFWKRNLCTQNVTKEQKQPPVFILQQAIFKNIFILCLWLWIIRRSDKGV